MKGEEEERDNIRLWQYGAVFLFAYAILVSRRPDAVFHAQFWAEDGHVWYADTYNFGWWTALFRAQDGYFQVFPRLAASLALLVPLALAPLVLNLIAIAVQAIPVIVLLSPRSSAWGTLRFRGVLAAVYLALPNCRELGAILTNSQWVLALSAFLLLAASAPRSKAGRLFDLFILLLCGLTGPFCVFLAPVAFFLAWRHRDCGRLAAAGVLAACCLVQAWGLLIANPSGRSHYAHVLGASPTLFAHLLAAHVYLGTLLGGNLLARNPGPGLSVFLVCTAAGGTALAAFCFIAAPVEMRLFLIFSAMLFAASLASPNTGSQPGMAGWEFLTGGAGIRYWFFPTLAFAWLLLWGFESRAVALKTVSAVLLCVMCFGVIRDWRIEPFKDLHWAQDAKRFESVPMGTAVTFPENPEGWDIRLVKR